MSNPVKVLIVDDEARVAESYRGYLVLDQDTNYHVEAVLHPRDVLAVAERFRPHVILLDNFFPEGEVGIDQLLPALKSRFESTKVIIITGQRGRELAPIQRALSWQADDFLDKPVDPKTLRDHVKRAYDLYLEETGER
ncbi:MAG: response regulator [Geobacteraceae bacterium]|nr:response regulator [Geobacteraceae bacterium]